MVRKDKNVTPSVTRVLQELGYSVADWDDSNSTKNSDVAEVFKTASKQKNSRSGYPDRLFIDQQQKLLIIVEEKRTVREHDLIAIDKGAISGVKWYLSCFLNKNLKKSLKNKFDTWKILGIAASGDFSQEYSNKFSAFYIDINLQKIISVPQLQQFVNEEKFIAVFNSLDEELAISQVAKSSHKINNMLRSIDSQKRPVLLSALMISLHSPRGISNSFPEIYKSLDNKGLVTLLVPRVKSVLAAENIPEQKVHALDSELSFINDDANLNNSDLLKNILIELQEAVLPLFDSKFSNESNYDIIGKFYEDFLSYAGVSNVKKGIVLTPRHITTLFTKLVPVKGNDVILDLASGTGSFLIAGMNAIIAKIRSSGSANAEEKIKKVKQNQLLGFEINATMYISAISNMLFRGDGKSGIYNYDSINDERTQDILDTRRPTIGFINPPYSGKENKTDPTPKETTFLKKMLDNVSRYGIIIAPTSMYFKDVNVRREILRNNKLLYVIKMPTDLFMPNAATHTTVSVFSTHEPHDYENDVVKFYDLRDDGFSLVKNKGRSDVYGKWADIENDLLDALIRNKKNPDGIIYNEKKITDSDEWTVEQHTSVDYRELTHASFINTIANHLMFLTKKKLDVLNKKLSDFTEFKLLSDYFSSDQQEGIGIKTNNKEPDNPLDISHWKKFDLVGENGIFQYYNNGYRLTKPDRIEGNLPLLTAGEYNQGVTQYIGNYEGYDFENQLVEKDRKTKPHINENSITIDMFFNVFYQPYRYASDDNVYSFTNKEIDTETALFITTVLLQQKIKYGYGRQFRKENAAKTQILLPVDNSGSVDYQFMRDYISSLPFADLLKYVMS